MYAQSNKHLNATINATDIVKYEAVLRPSYSSAEEINKHSSKWNLQLYTYCDTTWNTHYIQQSIHESSKCFQHNIFQFRLLGSLVNMFLQLTTHLGKIKSSWEDLKRVSSYLICEWCSSQHLSEWLQDFYLYCLLLD